MPTITLDISPSHSQRLASAIGDALDLRYENSQRRDATPAEVRQFIIDTLKAIVRQGERRAAERAIVQQSDIDLT